MNKKIDFAEIDRDVSCENFFNLLGKYGIEDSKPYIKSLADKRNYMLLSYELFINTKVTLDKRIKDTSDKKSDELKNSGYSSFGSSDTKGWNIFVDGFEIGYHDMFRKSAWDFFHYARLTTDMYLQIINATLLERKYPDEDVTFLKLEKELITFADMKEFLEEKANNPEYKYIVSFDNYMKHINQVPVCVKMKTAGLFDFTEMELGEIYLDSFNYRQQYFNSERAEQKLSSARDFVIKTTSQFLRILLCEQMKKTGDC